MRKEVSMWREYEELHQRSPDPGSERKVAFYEANRDAILYSNSLSGHQIAIIITAFNEEDFLPRTLASINTAITATPDNLKPRLVVVDNNSSDGTADIAKHYGAEVVSEKIKGIGQARQTGLEATNEKYILTTDADTIVPDDWIEKLAGSLASRECVMVYGRIVFLADKKRSWREFWQRNLYETAILPVKWIKSHFRKFHWPSSANLGFLSDVAKKVGGYPREAKAGEDFTLMERMKEQGVISWERNSIVYTSDRRLKQDPLEERIVNAFRTNWRLMLGADLKTAISTKSNYEKDFRTM